MRSITACSSRCDIGVAFRVARDELFSSELRSYSEIQNSSKSQGIGMVFAQ